MKATTQKKKVTLMLDNAVYVGIRARVGQRGVGEYLSELARPFVSIHELEEGYKALAKDTVQKREAREWLRGTDEPIHSDNAWRF